MTIAEYKDIAENPFDGTKGWITITTFDQRFGKPGKRFDELGFKYVREAVTSTGTIWVYLERFKIFNYLTKEEKLMKIIVAGTSDIKIAATKKAVYQVILTDIEVESVKIGSTGINEQPVGESEILEGAMKRAKLAKEADDSQNTSTIYLGIENGIEEQTPHNWFDYAFIYGIFPKGERVTKTIRCFFPEECVIATSKLPGGFKDNTVGKYMASIGLIKDHADPHIDLCGVTRIELLTEAIKDILISPKDGSGINTHC